MSIILWGFLLLGIYAVSKHSPGKAFVIFYVPILLLFPDAYHAMTPGLPDPSANMAIIIPIFLAALSKYGKMWRPTIADLLVVSIAVLMFVSEYQATNYAEAQNLMSVSLLQIIAPYFVARLCIANEQIDVDLAKRFTLSCFIVGVVGLYEFRMAFNPFLSLPGRIFTDHYLFWMPSWRHGFVRMAGPYAHPILTGMIMIIGYRLARWIEWNNFWEPKFSWLPNHPLSKGRIITLGILIGSLITVCRGPWLGGILGAVIVNVARFNNRKMAFSVALLLAVVVGIPAYTGFQAYTDVAGAAMTESQQTAIYRKQIFELYSDIALDHAWLGWGRNTWPKFYMMDSIDNYYLLLSLMHGVFTMLLFVGLMVWLCITLFIKGMSEPAQSNSLAFTFIGIIVAMFISLATVYLGENVTPAFFLIFGWAESYKHGLGMAGIFASRQSNPNAHFDVDVHASEALGKTQPCPPSHPRII